MKNYNFIQIIKEIFLLTGDLNMSIPRDQHILVTLKRFNFNDYFPHNKV